MKNKKHAPFQVYVNDIEEHFLSEQATEHTYRSTLEIFLKSFEKSIKVTNEPGRKARGKSAQNKPDLVVMKNSTPIGFIETKDMHIDLDDKANVDQINRYRDAYPNLIVTNYLEFRRYVKGELRAKIKIGRVTKKGLVYSDSVETDILGFFNDFLLEQVYSVSSSSELASRLALLTRQIRKLVKSELEIEEDSKRLHKLMIAFQKVLISDLDEDKFSDMFAQTLAYGFFAAKVHHDGREEFSRKSAAAILPKTNPFLRRLFTEFANEHLPDAIIGVVEEIVELLNKTDVKSVLTKFGELGKEDPVVHFYEYFLGEYDPKLKKSMGVYYTPDPVVSYIVNSLDEILEKEFGRKKGLADDKTLVLDPALGTGSFLSKVLQLIYDKSQKGSWNSYVADSLLDRVFGFEILMAPYAVAHLNLGIKLQDTGYNFERDQRLGVYLTNTLEETAKRSEVLFSDWISEEAEAASSIKRDKPIMVVVGNPPYSAISHNNGEWINGLMRGYDSISKRNVENYFECEGKPLNEKKIWLNDDYVKFMRFAQWRIEQTGTGITAFVTNHGFLDNPTFRGMRESLMKDFDKIYILDLHGNSKKKEESPDGSKDENVFDIQQGVSICFMFRTNASSKRQLGEVYRADLHGARDFKFDWLNKNSWKTTKFNKLNVQAPDYNFSVVNRVLGSEYFSGFSLKDIFPVNTTGFVTACDSLSIQFSHDEMWNSIREFVQDDISISKQKWDLGGNRDWQPEWAKDDVRSTGPKKSFIKKVQYRPFDFRWTYYTGKTKGFMCNPREDLMKNLLDENNLALISVRQVAEGNFNHALVTDCVADNRVTFSSKGTGYIFPIKIGKEYNLNEDVLTNVKKKISYNFTPEELFNYIYSILYSRTFRLKYADYLKMDYARIQFPSDKKLFTKLSKLGEELIEMHLMKSPELEGSKVIFSQKGNMLVEKVSYDEKSKKVWINKLQFFENVPKLAWQAEMGGYQILDKWLKSRKNRKLSHEDISHYEKMVEMILRTEKLMDNIDNAIEASGGWPLIKEKSIKIAA